MMSVGWFAQSCVRRRRSESLFIPFRMKTITCFLLTFMSALTLTKAANWKTGDAFPAIQLPSITGDGSSSITQYRGDKVLLHVFASW